MTPQFDHSYPTYSMMLLPINKDPEKNHTFFLLEGNNFILTLGLLPSTTYVHTYPHYTHLDHKYTSYTFQIVLTSGLLKPCV